MTDSQFAAYEAKCAAAARLRAEILPHNKEMLFDALSAAGIALVTVDFDGSGDSGQFEQPAAFDAQNGEMAVPDTIVAFQSIDFERSAVVEINVTVIEFIEQLTYDLLEEKHDGWEDGPDGAYGTFRFALDGRSITLEYNERYTETNYSEHQF